LSFCGFRGKFEIQAVLTLKRKKVIVLGSTGSIGRNTLEVLRALAPSFEVVALACRSNVGRLARQAHEFSPQAVAVVAGPGLEAAVEWADLRDVRVYRGEAGLLQMLAETQADLVVNGISGAGGLRPSVATLQRGMNLALANKETIVMAGPLVSELARRNGSRLLPVDSEHHALFHLMQGRKPEEVQEIILTASGGAFRELSYEQLGDVRVEDAVSHPNWDMGVKITVDSATMANKGLEVIEAHHLFEIPLSAIKVLIHPQSYIHSLIRTIDGFLYAQLSQPDMRLPIQDALTWPDLKAPCVEPFDITGRHFSFEPVDSRKYRLLALAYEAAEQGGGYPIAYNAANEVAVQRFLDHGISFLEIPRLVEETLLVDWNTSVACLEEILQIDREARRRALEILNN
jgi:1-deoxy-D-xylulose-5-phosphate reductoisomerase